MVFIVTPKQNKKDMHLILISRSILVFIFVTLAATLTNDNAFILKAGPVNIRLRFGRLDAGRLALLVSTC